MKGYTVKGPVSVWLSEWSCCDFTGVILRLFSLMSLLVAAAVQADTFSLDDGSVNTFGGTPGGDLLALNHFDTGGRTVVIDQISVLWNPLSAAVSPTVALYSDPDGDGNPSDASPLLIYPIDIPPHIEILNNTSHQAYDIPATSVAGSFFVGAYLSGGNSVIGVDLSHPQPNQSWILENTSPPAHLELEAPAATSTLVAPLNRYLNGNHMIRARYTVVQTCVQPAAGLISWWRAEGNASNIVVGNNGSLLGNTAYSPGIVGQGFQFDGSQGGVNVGNPTNLQVQNLTIEAWIKRASSVVSSLDTTLGPQGGIFYFGQGGYGLSLEPDGRLHFTKIGISNVQMASGGVTDTNWHHVAVTKSGSTIVFYVDGVAYPVATPYDPGFTFTTSAAIGTRGDGLGNTFFGIIDEPAIFDRALTADDIQALHAAGNAGKCVPAPSVPPSIMIQPQDQIKRTGDIATFAVVASGAQPLSYQWYFNSNPLDGRTNAALTLTNLQSDLAGSYFVTVTNAYGSLTSSVAQLFLTALPPPACIAAPTGAVAWWRAESNAVDSIGINDGLSEGVRVPLPTWYMAGKAGAAFRFFSGFQQTPSNYLFIPPSADLDLGTRDGITIEGWIKPDSISGVRPVVEWNDGRGNVGAGIGLNGSAVEAYLTDTNTTPIRRIAMRSPPGTIVSLAWQHVALTFDKAGGLATMFVNGVPVSQTNLGTFVPATQAPIYLAYRPSGTYARSSYIGGMDELTLYDRALTPAQIQAIIAAGEAGKCPPPPPPCAWPLPDLVAWWRGESNALDSVEANHGVIIDSVRYTTGIVGRAFEFETGYVRIPASSNLNVGAGPGLTIEMWVSPEFSTVLFTPVTRQFVGWHSGIVTQGVSLHMTRLSGGSRFSSSHVWGANLVDTQGLSHAIQSPTGLATSGVWQHVALTFDKASGMAALYFDGNAVTQTNLGTFTPKTTANLYLGYQTPSPILRSDDKSAMDEVSLYSRALSAAEIRAAMLARGAGKCTEPPVIVAQPGSIRVNEGEDATFAVTAHGNPILKCQWRRNGTNLPGETTTSLVLTNVQFDQGGTYSVRITNAFGVTVSSNATLIVNHAPLADATATLPHVMAPMNCTTRIVLDGSRSSDSEGDPLRFSWFETGAANAFATGVVAVVTLPAGTHSLTLVVDDGLGRSSQTFVVEVITAAQAVDRMIGLVNSLASKPQPLIASLSAAIASLDRGNATAAINQLQAFQNKVRVQVAPSDVVLGDQLFQAAQPVIDVLNDGCSSGKSRAKIGKVHHDANGKVRIQFSAPPGRAYIVEASTDLIEWTKIGLAKEWTSGEFEFEDANALGMPTRYYRAVIP